MTSHNACQSSSKTLEAHIKSLSSLSSASTNSCQLECVTATGHYSKLLITFALMFDGLELLKCFLLLIVTNTATGHPSASLARGMALVESIDRGPCLCLQNQVHDQSSKFKVSFIATQLNWWKLFSTGGTSSNTHVIQTKHTKLVQPSQSTANAITSSATK